MPQESGTPSSSGERGSTTDEGAFALLYAEHAAVVRSVALRIVRHAPDAEDVCQQTFFQAWMQRDRYDPARGDARGWLLRIARSRAIDHVRSARRRPFVLSDTTHDDDIVAPPALDDGECQEIAHRVSDALTTLAHDVRRVVDLSYVEGLTQRQIAVITGRPLGTIKTVLRAALTTVRTALESGPPPVSHRANPGEHDDAAERPFTTALFDRVEEAFARARRPGPPLPVLDGVHVLAVDDDEHTRTLLAGIFRNTGAQVTITEGAAACLSTLETVWPDVVVADITMPGLDGYGLMRQIRALIEQHERPLPALAFTACASEADRSRARLAGFDLHLSKPLHPAALMHAVHRLSGRG